MTHPVIIDQQLQNQVLSQITKQVNSAVWFEVKVKLTLQAANRIATLESLIIYYTD